MELFSQDAETAVLSAILKTPERVYNLNGLRPHMLSHGTNMALLDNMINMGEDNLQPNKQLVSSLLGANGKLDLVGGDAYLDYLVTQPQQTPENIDAFIENIKESYKTREFLSLVNKIDLEAIKRDGATEVIGNTQLELDKLLSNSGTGFIRQVGSLYNDVFDDIVKRTENPGIRGCPTGFKGLDVITGGYGIGDLWVVAGRPSMGKSALISNSQLCLAKTNETTLTFSKEMNTESLVERLISIDTGLSLSDIRLGNILKADVELIRSKKDAFKDYRIFLDSNFGADIHYIESAVRKYVQLNKVKVVFIDYLQLLSERDENQTQELGRITKKLKLLAGKLEICIVLLSQLNRSLESRENKRPILSDMRQSGSIEEDADVVIGLYRDEYYNGTESKLKGILEFIILKQRNGPIGTIPMKFSPDCITIIST